MGISIGKGPLRADKAILLTRQSVPRGVRPAQQGQDRENSLPPGICTKTRRGKPSYSLKRRSVMENIVGVRLGRDLWVDSGYLPVWTEQEGDAVGVAPVAQHS